MKKQSLYEFFFIMSGHLSEEESEKKFEKIKKIFAEFRIEKIEKRGKKQLAYAIKGNDIGFFYLIRFYAKEEDISNLELYCVKNDDILKFMFIESKEEKNG